MCGEPREQCGVCNAGLAPDMHHRQLARTEDPGKRLRADRQPPPGFFQGNQLGRRGQFQGEVLLPRGRARSGARTSGRRWHRLGFPFQVQGVQCAAETPTADPSGRSRDWGDSTDS